MKALLIIDMQKGSFTEETPRHQKDLVIERINNLSDLFRSLQYPVVIIQHDGTKEDCFIPGTDEWQLLDEIVTKPEDIFISKTANDSFYQTELDQLLKAKGINQITITGSATDFCVEATIQSALVKDYDLAVIGDGHTTADRTHLKAELLVEHYNWVWGNLSPTQGSIKVLSFDEYSKTLV
ncbi:cysteine hydrolase family protein [Dyadobacter psychrotolerans]|uniref:Cysteine hydrolase n=1 Tax=Dyadobacter psychrotolerans TaxID=2541721 RepID=A0A4R5DKJ8_9BACT|nr:cysteine hydrolase family protein [Dyadobacter psychrotolerans]TDE14569.1 cysteine hydrolase [Dyadobacter psychrotolerans]